LIYYVQRKYISPENYFTEYNFMTFEKKNKVSKLIKWIGVGKNEN